MSKKKARPKKIDVVDVAVAVAMVQKRKLQLETASSVHDIQPEAEFLDVLAARLLGEDG